MARSEKEGAPLVNKSNEAGSSTEQFDGSKLSSDIYLYTITAVSFTAAEKLMASCFFPLLCKEE
jgi:hypothetical protein